MRTRKVQLGIVLAAVAAIGSTGVASAASSTEELERAQDRLEEVRAELDHVSDTCERNERRVDRINTRIEDTLLAVTAAEVAVDRQKRAVDERAEEVEQLEARADDVHAAATAKVVSLYKNGLTDPTLHSLLMSSSAEQALGRAQVLNVVKYSDAVELEELIAARTAVDAQRTLLAEQQAAYEVALAERTTLADDLEELRVVYERKVARCNERIVELQHEEEIAAADERELAAAIQESGVPVDIDPVVSGGGWTWPASGPLTSGFGQRWGRLHAGIDIGAPTGAPIYAAKGGVVSYAGTMGGYGNIIVLSHGNGMTTRYAHQSALGASLGQQVRAGERIGSIGSTGNSTGPHLHFEVRINDQPQNPINYLP